MAKIMIKNGPHLTLHAWESETGRLNLIRGTMHGESETGRGRSLLTERDRYMETWPCLIDGGDAEEVPTRRRLTSTAALFPLDRSAYSPSSTNISRRIYLPEKFPAAERPFPQRGGRRIGGGVEWLLPRAFAPGSRKKRRRGSRTGDRLQSRGRGEAWERGTASFYSFSIFNLLW